MNCRDDSLFIQVAVITLNNPSKLNALTEDMGNELTATVGQLEGKKELRAAILTGDNAVVQRESHVSCETHVSSLM